MTTLLHFILWLQMTSPVFYGVSAVVSVVINNWFVDLFKSPSRLHGVLTSKQMEITYSEQQQWQQHPRYVYSHINIW